MAAMTAATVALLLASCQVALVCVSGATVTMNPSDRAALEAMRAATWSFPAIQCGEYNFKCDKAGRVYELILSGIHGRIAPEIGNLTKLTRIVSLFSYLTGGLPDSIGRLTSLTYLSLSFNQMSGPIPESIGRLKSLQFLYLDRNAFTGNIPDSIGQLTSLQTLHLYDNQLSGNIPDSIGQLKSLKLWYGYNNQLSGSIPNSIGQMESLVTLELERNQLSGRIPYSIGQLKSLKWLELWGNQLNGSIPDSVGQMSSLQYLQLSENQLSGRIPNFLVQLNSSLTSLEMSTNRFTGNFPNFICQLSLLRSIGLSQNKLSGRIPECIGQLKSLEFLFIRDNQLIGGIPNSISELKSIYYVDIAINYFSGPVTGVNGQPSCQYLTSNCLFGSSLPSNCPPGDQRTKKECEEFCDATQVGGSCGGHGICSNNTDTMTIKCICDQGFNNVKNKFTCVGLLPPNSRETPPPKQLSPPRTPPPPTVIRPPPKNPSPPTPKIVSPPPPPRPLPPPSPPKVKPKPPTNFTFTSFERNASIIYLNDALLWSPWLRLTSSSTNQHGQTLYASPIEFLHTNAANSCQGASFQTSFSFRIRNNNSKVGEGLAFFLLASNANLKNFGKGGAETLGYTYHGSPRPGSVAIAFDTFTNVGELRQRNVNFRESFRSTAILPKASKILNRFNRTLYSWVDYDNTSTTWKVYLSASVNKPIQTLVTYKKALCDLLRPTECSSCKKVTSAYIGFTASTSSSHDVHEVRDWKFTRYGLG